MKLKPGKLLLFFFFFLSSTTTTLAQNVTVPSTCTPGFSPGLDTVIYTIPYTYAQTLSIIGSYKNLTWSGNPDDTVTLNGSDNTVGTARSYSIAGANLVETLLVYDSPPGGPYYENHNLALITVAVFGNVSLYAQDDATTVVAVCDGRATRFNFTARFCASDVGLGVTAFHTVHTADAQGAAKLLGGMNFTSCEALGGSMGTASMSGMGPVATFSGGAGGPVRVGWSVVVGVALGVVAVLV